MDGRARRLYALDGPSDERDVLAPRAWPCPSVVAGHQTRGKGLPVAEIVEEARKAIERRERRRAEQYARTHQEQLLQVSLPLEAKPNRPRSALEGDVAVERDWLFLGMVVDLGNVWARKEEEPDRLFCLLEGDNLTAYLLGVCSVCDRPTPLLPALDPERAQESLGEAAVLQEPVEAHRCEAVPRG